MLFRSLVAATALSIRSMTVLVPTSGSKPHQASNLNDQLAHFSVDPSKVNGFPNVLRSMMLLAIAARAWGQPAHATMILLGNPHVVVFTIA